MGAKSCCRSSMEGLLPGDINLESLNRRSPNKALGQAFQSIHAQQSRLTGPLTALNAETGWIVFAWIPRLPTHSLGAYLVTSSSASRQRLSGQCASKRARLHQRGVSGRPWVLSPPSSRQRRFDEDHQASSSVDLPALLSTGSRESRRVRCYAPRSLREFRRER